MINILLEGYDINAEWLYNDLRNYIKPNYKVAVVAFSFRDSRVKCLSDWNALYSKENGKLYNGIITGFTAYGVLKDNISFINYFSDTKETAKRKIQSADIIYFLGGLPDRMMDRINEFELKDVLLSHNGIIMGYSAGAVIQFEEYFLSPDEDHKEFSFYKGIPYLKDFYLQVHYEGTQNQNESIKRVASERDKPVYVLIAGKGAMVVDNGEIKLIGNCRKYLHL